MRAVFFSYFVAKTGKWLLEDDGEEEFSEGFSFLDAGDIVEMYVTGLNEGLYCVVGQV